MTETFRSRAMSLSRIANLASPVEHSGCARAIPCALLSIHQRDSPTVALTGADFECRCVFSNSRVLGNAAGMLRYSESRGRVVELAVT